MEIFKLFGSIFVDSSSAEKSISNTSKKANGLASKFGSVAKSAAKMGAGIAAGTAALFKIATSATEAGDNIDKMSQKIGISREAYQEFDYVAKLTGTDVDLMKNGMKNLRSAMDSAVEGTGKGADAFKSLGISITDTNGNMKTHEDLMWEAFNALQGVTDETEKAKLATTLFGKAGTDLMPMLNGATGSIDEMRQKAHDLGLVMGDDAIDASVQFQDTLTKVKDSFEAVVNKIGIAVLPMFQSFLDWVLEHMPEIQSVAEKVFGAIQVVVQTVIDVVKKVYEKFEEFLKWVTDSEEPFTTIFNAISDVAVKAFEAISNFWEDTLKPAFEAIKSFIEDTLAPAFDTVFGTISDTVNGVIESIQSAISWLEELWDTEQQGTQEEWENGEMPMINYIGGSIPNPNYKPYAKAMDNAYLLDSATIFGKSGNDLLLGGEAGDEMIIGKDLLLNSISQASGGARIVEFLQYQFEKMFDIMGKYFPQMAQRDIVLDTGAIVGGTVDKMKEELDDIYSMEKW